MKLSLKKLKTIPQGVKASIAFFAASLVSKGISYIVTPIYTRLLDTEQYGQVAVYMTWLEIFGIIAMFCLSYGVFNNGMVDHPDKRDEFSFSLLILSNIITLCFAAIIFALYPLIKSIIQIDWPLLLLMFLVFLFQPAYNFWTTRQRYELKYKTTVLFSILSALVSPLTAIICILAIGKNAVYERIFGAEIALILIYIGFYIYLGIKSKFKINTSFWKEAIIFNLPLIPHYLSMYLLSSSDKIMISLLVSDTATAYYSIAHSVAAVVLVLWTAINSSFIPFTYEKLKTKDFKSIAKASNPILLIFAAGCILIILLAPEVVMIMSTDNYMEAIYAIPPIVGGVFFQVHYYLYSNPVYYYKKPVFIMISSITATILNIILNYFFIKKFGYIAAGYTTLVSYLVQAAIDYIVMKKVVKEKIFDMKFIGILSFFVIIIALLSNLIYNYPYIRYSALILIIVLIIVFHKKILKLLGVIRKPNNINLNDSDQNDSDIITEDSNSSENKE